MNKRYLSAKFQELAEKSVPVHADKAVILDSADSNNFKRSPLKRTDAEIKTQYEANDDTNAFSDSEETKLTGIEAGAEVNQTDGEIKTQYEANDDTNAFTDNEQTKLAGLDPTKIEGIVTKEAAFDLEAGDAGKLIRVDAGVDTDCTIRENATHEIPISSVFEFTQAGAGAINFIAGGATIINTFGDAKTAGQFAGIKLIKVGTDLWDTFKYE